MKGRGERATVRAAGGVVCRGDGDDREVLVVHRPRYDDWTFPKGKAERGEADDECALREVLEETGFACRLEDELLPTSYLDSQGRPKRVRYWLMRVVGGSFTPSDEVDELRWCTVPDARTLLTYERDHALLDALRRDRAAKTIAPGHLVDRRGPALLAFSTEPGLASAAMSARQLVALVAVVLGIVLVVVGAIYWAEPAKSLPSFFPGHHAHSPHHHVKRAVVALVVGVILLAVAWLQAGRRRRSAPLAP